MTALNDLIIQVQEGDGDAFEPVIQRFQDMAVGYSYAMLQDWQLAEDAAQEAFINAYLDIASLKDPKAFPGWFRRIVFKQIDRIRRKRRSAVSLDQGPPIPVEEPTPSESYQNQEVRDSVMRAIQSLPEQQREAVTLYYISEYSYKEISAFLDLPTSTIKMRLYYARMQLKEALRSMVEEHLSEKRPSINDDFKEKLMSFQIHQKHIPTQQVLSICHHASMKDLQAHLDGSIKTLIVYAQSESKHGSSKDVEIDGLPFAIYHKRDSAETLFVEICLPVKGGIESTQEIEVKKLASADVAYVQTTLRQSIFPGVLKAYEDIEAWFRSTDHQAASPPRETYLNYDHSIFSAAAQWEDPCLEIAWPYKPIK